MDFTDIPRPMHKHRMRGNPVWFHSEAYWLVDRSLAMAPRLCTALSMCTHTSACVCSACLQNTLAVCMRAFLQKQKSAAFDEIL